MTQTQNTQSQSFSKILSSFDREIAGLVVKYARNELGNLWADDIRQEAGMALFKALRNGKITPDPVTGLLDDSARRIAYMDMRHAVHVRVSPLRRTLSASASTLDKYYKLNGKLAKIGAGADVLGVKEIAGLLGVSVEIARNLVTLRQGDASLNATLGYDEESGALIDFLEDEAAECPAGNLIRKERLAAARRLLDTLPPRRRELLMRRFGLDAGDEISCAELAAERGCTRQTIDEQCRGALNTLRSACAAGELAFAA